MANSGNANTTISYPGPHWEMLWDNGKFGNFQLDIVGFLAVLGEGSVLANSQVSALSRLFYLPRLIPAPQALLPPSRPTSLPSRAASVTGVYSGNVKHHVHHVANILLGEDLSTFTVRCVEIKKRSCDHRATRMDTVLRGVPVRAKTQSPAIGPPPVTAKATGPLSWVTLLGTFLSLTLFTTSMVFGDGMSLIATLLLSFLSTLTGIANKWSLRLPRRPHGAWAPPGDTVIRYPNGSYLVVRCDEDVARELYFAPEEIEYNVSNAATYRMISLLGTLILMLGIIALANAKLQLQFAWAGAYIIVNAAHWIVAAVPQRLHWDLSCYEVKEQSVEGGPKNRSFTDALWKAILLTKNTRWVRNGKAAPETQKWDDWLLEAERVAKDCKSHTGPLIDPIWPGKDSPHGIIWNVPTKWDAKEAWNNLNDGIDEAERNDDDLPRPLRTSMSEHPSVISEAKTLYERDMA